MSKKLGPKELIKKLNIRGRALKEIIDLHEPADLFGDGQLFCVHCVDGDPYTASHGDYPCPTAQIIMKHHAQETQ